MEKFCKNCYRKHFSPSGELVFEGNCGCPCHVMPSQTHTTCEYGGKEAVRNGGR